MTTTETYGPRYVAAALAAETERVAGTPEGSRNITLNAATYSLARLIGPHLAEDQLTAIMLAAAEASGLPRREAAATIRSAIRARNRRSQP